MYQSQGWFVGPEIVRGFGALIIVLLHTVLLVPSDLPLYRPGFIWRVVYTGNFFLELFFALSGFLLGATLLEQVHSPVRQAIKSYLLRRMTRIFPAYYAILLGLALNELLFADSWRLTWQHLIFLQHYSAHPHFLAVAWFLDVEIWSYILLPLIVFGGQRCMPVHWQPVWRVMVMACCVITLMLALRCLTMVVYPDISMDEGIRKPVHLRLDALMYGLLMACCKKVLPHFYSLLQTGTVVFILLLFIVFFIEVQYGDFFIRNMPGHEKHRLFHAGFGFTLMGSLVALLLPWLEKLNGVFLQEHLPRLGHVLLTTATISYSLYLIHLPVLCAFARMAGGTLSFLLYMCGAWFVSFVLAHLLWKWVEVPGMRLRIRMRRSAGA